MRRQLIVLSVMLFALPAVSSAQETQQVFPARGTLVTTTSDTTVANAQAIQLSDAYYTRLTIHRYASYTEFPLFAAEYYLGNKLIKGTTSSSVKPLHKAAAYGL